MAAAAKTAAIWIIDFIVFFIANSLLLLIVVPLVKIKLFKIIIFPIFPFQQVFNTG